jgi:aminoglycoside phosphotransferase (APT) family kinase protein
MPSPLTERRTLGDLTGVLRSRGLVRPGDDLVGAELLVGWESAVVSSRSGWIYRFGRCDPDSFRRELEVLAAVEGRLGVATPRIEAADHDQLLMIYRTLTGAALDLTAVLGQSAAERRPLVSSLAGALASMHDLRAELDHGAAFPRTDPGPLVAEVRAARTDLDARDRAAVDAVLDAWEGTGFPAADTPTVLLHGDFHFGNMVFGAPTGPLRGLWDFSCVEVGDPTADLRYLTGDSTLLAAEVADAYEGLTGRRLDVASAGLLRVLEDVADAVTERRPVAEVLPRRP